MAGSPASGSAFPVGVNAVQCTAWDAAGNTSSCSFNVTVAEIATIEWLSSKREMHRLQKALLDHGAVSEHTVIAMQQGIFMETRAGAGISVSGIAGPGGGSVEKPAGTVWIAVSRRDQMVHTQKFLFTGDRREVRLQAVEASLKALLELVERG